jgi:acyl carrier protein
LTTIRAHLALRGVDADRVTPDARFGVDLDLDSLDLQTLTQELEDEFGVRTNERDAAGLNSVGEIIAFVAERSCVPTAP